MGGTSGGLALPDKGTGAGGTDLPLIQLPSFEGGHALLATVLRDNATSALDCSYFP